MGAVSSNMFLGDGTSSGVPKGKLKVMREKPSRRSFVGLHLGILSKSLYTEEICASKRFENHLSSPASSALDQIPVERLCTCSGRLQRVYVRHYNIFGENIITCFVAHDILQRF